MSEDRLKILLVEDNTEVAQLMREMLLKARNVKFEVLRVDKLSACLKLLSEEQIDVVLLDLTLPDSSGFETFTQVYKQALHLPIIVLTGIDDETLATKTVREGAQDYIVKSEMDITLLVRAIRYAVERKKTEEALRQARDELEQRVEERTIELKRMNEYLKKEIEERRNAEEEVSVAYTKLQETQAQLVQAAKMQVVGGLASGVAHEVKNPLAIILQCVEYLEKKMPKNDKNIVETLNSVKSAVSRADNIVRGLMDFSSVSQLDIVIQPIAPALERVLMLLKHQLDKYHIEVIKEIPQNLPEVKIDKNRMEQVFLNLMMNAIDAMKDSGTLTIKGYTTALFPEATASSKKKDMPLIQEPVVIFEIEDTGPGIPDEIIPRIFDPFFTTKRDQRGAGLGLSIVRSIIEMHKGKIEISKRKDCQGTKVTVILKT